tara:strand:- start:29 stop:913 length:885 start_codon:yes stop_codon:yes gene_type:complete
MRVLKVKQAKSMKYLFLTMLHSVVYFAGGENSVQHEFDKQGLGIMLTHFEYPDNCPTLCQRNYRMIEAFLEHSNCDPQSSICIGNALYFMGEAAVNIQTAETAEPNCNYTLDCFKQPVWNETLCRTYYDEGHMAERCHTIYETQTPLYDSLDGCDPKCCYLAGNVSSPYQCLHIHPPTLGPTPAPTSTPTPAPTSPPTTKGEEIEKDFLIVENWFEKLNTLELVAVIFFLIPILGTVLCITNSIFKWNTGCCKACCNRKSIQRGPVREVLRSTKKESKPGAEIVYGPNAAKSRV